MIGPNTCTRCSTQYTEWGGNLQDYNGKWICVKCKNELQHNAIKRAILKFEKANPKEGESIDTRNYHITYKRHISGGFRENPVKTYIVQLKQQYYKLKVDHWLPNLYFDCSYGWSFKVTTEGGH